MVLIGKSREDVKIWPKEVFAQRESRPKANVSLLSQYSIEGIGDSGSPLPSVMYTHNCQEKDGHGKNSLYLSWDSAG